MSLTLRFPKYHGHELAYNAISIIVSNTTSIQIYIKYIYTIYGLYATFTMISTQKMLYVQCVYIEYKSNALPLFNTKRIPWFVKRCARRLSNIDSTRLRHYTRLREKDIIQGKEIYSVIWHKQTIIHSLRHWDWYQRYKMKSDYYWLIVYHHTRLRWLIRKTWLSHVSYSERTLSWLTLFT